ncbi:hypothetical protein SAMD00019534_009520 [Acytostelium subglobosum LB1]|uniref:hypothetical protein n=1 Tax=Acytostelium subglobosum LB1 TaxID=1410327 RepID=UPI000644D4B5|nr:hypothetical protein SAMD00019534_009520 [Acytostelium subglobosum LB1]GAM17777.1 hypothetical protein SAMD00019534_009520 [Acytostelium subglobosum LB1]|eukprot:XP_012758373.1 hypothetical protein SAMD00019534_009520 [Acytostelium subglobosum LB1]
MFGQQQLQLPQLQLQQLQQQGGGGGCSNTYSAAGGTGTGTTGTGCCNIINFSYASLGCTVHCEAPSFSEDLSVSNIIHETLEARERGFLSAQFVRTPLDITISFPYPIDVERISVRSKLGTGIAQSLSFYTSQSSFDEIEANAKRLLEQSNRQHSEDTKMAQHPQHSMLSVSKWDTSKERYPGGLETMMKKESMHSTAAASPSGSHLVYNKLVHQSFQFVGHFDDLYQQDKLYTYFCHPSFRGQSQPSMFNGTQPEQVKTFGSNVYLLNNIKSIRIRILKVFQSSCPSIGGIEVWGLPAAQCPQNVVAQIYQSSMALQPLLQQQQQQLLFPTYQTMTTTSTTTTTTTTSQSLSSHPMQFSLPTSKLMMNNDNSTTNNTSALYSPRGYGGHRSTTLGQPASDSDMDVEINDFDKFLQDNPDIVLNEAGVPTKFVDPITLELMNEPVALPSGNYVDRKTIQKLFDNQYFNDPFSGIRITNTQTDYSLQQQIINFHESKKRKRLIKTSRPVQVSVVSSSPTASLTNLSVSDQSIFTNHSSHSNSNDNSLFSSSNSINNNGLFFFGNSGNYNNSNGNSIQSSTDSLNNNHRHHADDMDMNINGAAFFHPLLFNNRGTTGMTNPFHDSHEVTPERRSATFGGHSTKSHPLLKLMSQTSLVELPIKRIKK